MKKLCLNLVLIVSLLMVGPAEMFYATEESQEEMTVAINLDDIAIGDTIVLYENKETGEKLQIQVLPVKMARTDTGTGNWSGGYIPADTYTLYATYDAKYYVELGFSVTYDGANRKILEVYNESIDSYWGEISEVSSRIITAKPTDAVPAKAQMSWLYSDWAYAGLSCYLRMDINTSNQMRIAWRVND